jgi:hypothetical protein
MKRPKDKINYFFVDESGDPVFYDRFGNLILGKSGVSKTLILGFIQTDDPSNIRKALSRLRDEIENDEYLKDIPSLKKTLVAFHAKDDCPEVRERVFKLIKKLYFTAEIIVARKIPQIFNKRHKRNENNFYDDLIKKLFQNKLHLSKMNKIYFAVRGNKTRQKPIEEAIQRSIDSFEQRWRTKVESVFKIQPQTPSGEPCLQVIDYINWAVQRAFEKKEERFFKFIEEKIVFLVDIYDINRYPKNFYSQKNKFDLKKISPL